MQSWFLMVGKTINNLVIKTVAVSLAKVASDVKASDIRVLFVKPLVYWTHFFIIVTAFSRPQIDAIRYGLLTYNSSYNIFFLPTPVFHVTKKTVQNNFFIINI